MAWTYTYDTATPAGSDDPAEADDRMQEIKAAVQERLNVEHVFDLTGTEVSHANTGKHTDITCTSIVNAGALAQTGNFTLNTDKFTIDAATGNVVVAGTLNVTGVLTTTAAAVLGDGSKLAAATESADGDRVIVDLNYAKTGDTVQHDSQGGYSNCDVDGTKTKVYTKYLTGTLNSSASENIAHGITTGMTKILSLTMHIYSDDASAYVVQEVRMAASSSVAVSIFYNDTNIVLQNKGSNIVSNNYRIKIDYIL